MKPVDQTITGDLGDCLRACVCSLLELNIEDVPNFAEIDFFTGLDSWLKERGMRFIRVGLPTVDFTWGEYKFSEKNMWFGYPLQEGNTEHMLMWGHSSRLNSTGGNRQHIVVSRPNGYGMEMVHDPHPDKNGLINCFGFGWIVPTGDAIHE